jgi:spore coat protein I
MFLYPDKYWKQVHQYLTKSKTWIPEKNFNKLQNIEMQEADRQNFIRYLEKCKALSQSQ